MDRYTAAYRRTEDWSGLSFGRTTARLLRLKTEEPLVRVQYHRAELEIGWWRCSQSESRAEQPGARALPGSASMYHARQVQTSSRAATAPERARYRRCSQPPYPYLTHLTHRPL